MIQREQKERVSSIDATKKSINLCKIIKNLIEKGELIYSKGDFSLLPKQIDYISPKSSKQSETKAQPNTDVLNFFESIGEINEHSSKDKQIKYDETTGQLFFPKQIKQILDKMKIKDNTEVMLLTTKHNTIFNAILTLKSVD